MPAAMRFREDTALSVAQLNRVARLGIEQMFGDVLVMGEVSDLTRAASGHLYFTLNDENEQAQVRVVMFKSDVRRSRVSIEGGARIAVRGALTLYEARGSFQLLARQAYPAGEGDLAAQFRKLVEKLSAEGLTDPARKRALPLLPRCIGLVTSEQGAALHDVIRVAEGRCPVRIVVAPCLVQGEFAPRSIVTALRAVQRVPELDVVIIARGGGSAEDLWAFNDESVARAIVACRVPVVSGVGHEVDTTICDLVADVRAATPSNAAELVVPMRATLSERVFAGLRALTRAAETRIDRDRLKLTQRARRLRDPRPGLGRAQTTLHGLERRLSRAADARLAHLRLALDESERRLALLSPRARLITQRVSLTRLYARLSHSGQRWLGPQKARLGLLRERCASSEQERLSALRTRLSDYAIMLDAISPLRVLARGYAIALREENGRAVLSARELAPGDKLRLRLSEGQVRAEVIE
jgi:exodeoxyribonuclease VII large subunit